MGTTKHNAIKSARKISEKTGELVLIIHDSEYQEIYGESCAYYPIRESRFDGLEPEQTIVNEVQA